MSGLSVAFDVDGTLIDENDEPREDIIDLLVQHYKDGDEVFVWSGGGMEYSRNWVVRLGLNRYVTAVLNKAKGYGIDIAYDDQIVSLGLENVCVGGGDYEERW